MTRDRWQLVRGVGSPVICAASVSLSIALPSPHSPFGVCLAAGWCFVLLFTQRKVWL